MASLNIFNKQLKVAKEEEDFDVGYYGQESDYEIPVKEEQRTHEKPEAAAKSVFGAPSTAPAQMKLIRPTSFNDGQAIANALMENHPVLIHLENASKEVSHDLVCFLTGVVYAIGGQIQLVSETTYMLSPRSMEITEEPVESEQPEQRAEEDNYKFTGFSNVDGYYY